ncbi:MAG: transposase [Opitutaceae bacterium]|nr:transposase [Cytophagales bacterium]
MQNDVFEYKRKSYIEIGNIYFWTATIINWQKLLAEDEFKDVVISSLEYLSKQGKTDVFAFVIMPNHVHLVWRIKELNGKESAHGSFLKYTAHIFKQLLKVKNQILLNNYKVDALK